MLSLGNVVIEVFNNYEETSKAGAELLAAQIKEKPKSVVCFATGSSPIGMYKELISQYNQKQIDFSQMTAFNLDEYYPIAKTSDQSYYYFMNENLFKAIDLDESRRNIPDGKAEDYEAECKAYDEKIAAAGGIDFQILGIGQNAHIGFNEPADMFIPNTHKVALDETTIAANARFFASVEDVPRFGLTMGIKSIMMSKKILLIATGTNKAQAVYDSFMKEITPRCPGSVLQLHPDVTVLVDKEAFSLIKKNS